MKNKEHLRLLTQPVLVSSLLLFVLIVGILGFTKYKMGLWEKDVRMDVLDLLSSKKSNLEKALYSRIYYTRGVAAYVALNPDINHDEYAQLAKEYIRNDTVIGSMALSKDCIISDIYPVEGHEAAIGLNLLEHPARKAIVEKTIETHLTFVAGPVELVEGGIAFISYTPIFDKTGLATDSFWGVTDIVIRQESLFKEAGLCLLENNYLFALKGVDGTGFEGDEFWGDAQVFKSDPVTTLIELPIGNWVLAAVPQNGWKQYADQDRILFIILLTSAIIISILIGLFSRTLLKLRMNEKELKAIFASLDSLIIEFSATGEYLKVAETNSKLLYLPTEKLIGKKLHQIFDEEQVAFFMKGISDCLRYKKLVVIEYPLQINGEERWFSARISYKSENSIIYNAHDVTAAKVREKQLKELNDTKDTLFSIIAHDLRGPLSGQKGVIDMILEEYESLDESTRKHLLNDLQESSSHLYDLLENLLKWAMSQSGRINVNKKIININEQYSNVFSQFKKSALLKQISFKNELNGETTVCADIILTEVVLRNLISNAIKFSNSGAEIRVYSKQIVENNRAYCLVSVNDTGIGMAQEKIESLFQPNSYQASMGTNNEKGNGLGLMLCKEFVEKQGGEIQVSSSLGKGSTFSFTLPLS